MADEQKVTHNIKSLNKRIEELEKALKPTDLAPHTAQQIAEPIAEKLGQIIACIAKMAHYSGTERIILEHGFDKYDVEANDMKKYK